VEEVVLLVLPPVPPLPKVSLSSAHAASRDEEAMTAVKLTVVRKKCRIEEPLEKDSGRS
jgi:hypothetical protein